MDCYDVLTTLGVLDSFSDLAAVTVTATTAAPVTVAMAVRMFYCFLLFRPQRKSLITIINKECNIGYRMT